MTATFYPVTDSSRFRIGDVYDGKIVVAITPTGLTVAHRGQIRRAA